MTHATYPGNWTETLHYCRNSMSPLFGLAPDGVYLAATVTGRAVRSYRTLSPLPKVVYTAEAVYFLWHFPWGYPRRVLPGILFPWSPDFPLPDLAGSNRPTI